MDTLKKKPTVHQYGSTLSLFGMVLNGDITTENMQSQGNHGLGVENALRSELIVIDNAIYTIDVVGNVVKANADVKASYMTMWDFKPEKTIEIKNVDSYLDFDKVLKTEMESENSFYAYKVKGVFSFLEMTSAVEYQNNETLIENRDRRVFYTRKNVKGDMVGLFTPTHAAAISFPGMHFHFLSDDLSIGGHVEEIKIEEVTIEIQKIDKLDFTLPEVENIKTATMNLNFIPPAVPFK